MIALQNTPVPVPKMYLYCSDDKIIGTPFYVMQFIEGRIFTGDSLLELSPREINEILNEVSNTLSKLHRKKKKIKKNKKK